ncbi:MAG: helix-turn-helix domain-containing protein [Clostridia bacterium]|nr:helix-turn-helix domain-containing protein [Clostridia bacterium]
MYTSLNQLIESLEYGTNLHIGVQFFGNIGNDLLALPVARRIHSSPICDEAKARPNGLRRCYRCRNLAFQKALKTKQPFGGLCINGLYEYLHPLLLEDEVAAVIYIGNIGIDPRAEDFPKERCPALAETIESYIRMLLILEPPRRDPLVENLKSYLDGNLTYGAELSHMARLFHYNEKYLGRLFKQKTGETVGEYVNRRRLEVAKKLLRSSDAPVIEVAAQVGFNNVTYFNRLFKRQYGRTPTAYRKG